MKVAVLGTKGYIGSVVVERLAEHGHEVVPLSRPQVDLTDPASLTKAIAADVDVIVHAGAMLGDEEADLAAIDALVGTGKKVIYTSGVWVLGASGEAADEDAPVNPPPIVDYRPRLEQRVLAAGGVVLRPGVVHGRGAGIPALLLGAAKEYGLGRYVGAATTRWPMVHVDDLADLYLAALGSGGVVLHGVAEEAVSVKSIAQALGRAGGVCFRAVPWTDEEARELFGEKFAGALALDQVISSRRTRQELGWTPSRLGILPDLMHGSYA